MSATPPRKREGRCGDEQVAVEEDRLDLSDATSDTTNGENAHTPSHSDIRPVGRGSPPEDDQAECAQRETQARSTQRRRGAGSARRPLIVGYLIHAMKPRAVAARPHGELGGPGDAESDMMIATASRQCGSSRPRRWYASRACGCREKQARHWMPDHDRGESRGRTAPMRRVTRHSSARATGAAWREGRARPSSCSRAPAATSGRRTGSSRAEGRPRERPNDRRGDGRGTTSSEQESIAGATTDGKAQRPLRRPRDELGPRAKERVVQPVIDLDVLPVRPLTHRAGGRGLVHPEGE